MEKQIFKISRDDVRYIRASYAGYSALQGADLFAAAAWDAIGKKRGFDGQTAGPVHGKDERYVLAVPLGETRPTTQAHG